MWIVQQLFGGIFEAIMSVLPWVLLGASVAVAVAAFVLGNFITRLIGLVLAVFLFGGAMFYFGADSVRDAARIAMLRIELAQKQHDLDVARSSVEYWTKQHAEQTAETDQLNQRVKDYEAELAEERAHADNTPVEPGTRIVYRDRCTLNQRDVDRLRNLGR